MTRPEEYAYSAFGLTVLCNRRLPALPPARGDGSRKVRIHISEGCVTEVGTPTSAPAFAAGCERLWAMDDGGWLLRYEAVQSGQGAWTMRLGGGGDRIDVERTAGVPVDDLLQVVQTAGLSAALQLAGAVVLHGCAIEVGRRAIIVAGPSGVGKSTTAAAFVTAGHALLSDDMAAIDVDGEPVVHCGLTQLRVPPRTAHAVGWDLQRLPRVFGTEILGDKRRVELSESAGSFCPQPRRIAAIYILRDRGPSERGARPEVRALTPRQAVPVLLGNCYRMGLLDYSRRANLLTALARLAQDVPVRQIRAADDLASLPLLLDALASPEAEGPRWRNHPQRSPLGSSPAAHDL